MMRSTRELNTTLKREPSIRELAEKMGVSGRYVQKLQNISRKSYSLDATYNDRGDQSLLDKLEDDRFPLPIDIVNAGKRAVQILEKIGNAFGVTRERVRQIEAKALGKLKKFAEKKEIKSPDSL
jgi:RNA polymerase primary sigma factor